MKERGELSSKGMSDPEILDRAAFLSDGRARHSAIAQRTLRLVRWGASAAVVVVAGVAVGSGLFSFRSPQGVGSSPVPSDQGLLASPSVATPSSSTVAAVGLTEEEAVAVARANAPTAADGRVLTARAGDSASLLQATGLNEFSAQVSADRWIWIIDLAEGDGLGAEGSLVVIDYVDGRVYGVIPWRS